MNASKLVTSLAAAIVTVGAISVVYAQSNAATINKKSPNNLTQTQSDAALPCQPGPFNPHLPNDPKNPAPIVNGTSADCATVTNTGSTNSRTQRTTGNMPVAAQTDSTLPNQPTPFNANSSASTQSQPPSQAPAQSVSAPGNSGNDMSTMPAEREPRADRN